MQTASTDEKRQLGIYYTPNEATKILCAWAIRNADDLLLEPSFGACGFLAASRQRLQELQSPDPARQLFGCDIDTDAFYEHLWPMFDHQDDLTERFLGVDFLSLPPNTFNEQFHAVIGNPPYVSHHRMSEKQKQTVAKVFYKESTSRARRESESPVRKFLPGGRADLWAYFVLHSLNFLRPNGRMAYILPGSFFQADYATAVQDALSAGFNRSLAIQLGQKLFVSEGAKENTVVLLAEGWQQGANPLKVEYAHTLEDLQKVIAEWDAGRIEGRTFAGKAQASLLSETAQQCLATVDAACTTRTLGDYCRVLIGIVTGANNFFVINWETAQKHQLPQAALIPILSKFGIVRGLSLNTNDLQQAADGQFRCLLVNTAGLDHEAEVLDSEFGPLGALAEYLESFPPADREKNKTFKKRSVWHRPDDGITPDAFLSYMHEHGPRLVLNEAQSTSTNTVHRVYFHPQISNAERLGVAIALQSVYSQLSAEIEGRAYGSGVLKHEPSGAKRIQLLLPAVIDEVETQEAFDQVDQLLRQGELEQARQRADRWAFADIIAHQGEVAFVRLQGALKAALSEMRAKRHLPSIKNG